MTVYLLDHSRKAAQRLKQLATERGRFGSTLANCYTTPAGKRFGKAEDASRSFAGAANRLMGDTVDEVQLYRWQQSGLFRHTMKFKRVDCLTKFDYY